MKATRSSFLTRALIALLAVSLLWRPDPVPAKDIDTYAVNAKQNCMILLDSSGSMNFPVYEHHVDYAGMYDYLLKLKDTTQPSLIDYIKDPDNGGTLFGALHTRNVRKKIYLVETGIGVSIVKVKKKDAFFTGDSEDLQREWKFDGKVDTHTLLDENGNLVSDGSQEKRRLTVDSAGYVLFDGNRLSLNMDIKLHDFVTLHDGTVVDQGFAGLLAAPGFHFSGYKDTGGREKAQNNTFQSCFLVTGNWINMRAVRNLRYSATDIEKNVGKYDLGSEDVPWKRESSPVNTASWTAIPYAYHYPKTDKYPMNVQGQTIQTIEHKDAVRMRIHFASFDVEGDGSPGFKKDYVRIYDKSGTPRGAFDNDNNPTQGDGWSFEIPGDTAIIKFRSDESGSGSGFVIDKIAVTYQADPPADGATARLQSRLEVAREAMLSVVEAFRGTMNWGLATFDAEGKGNGASIRVPIDPDSTGGTNSAAMATKLNEVKAVGGTPLMEALQDVFEKGFNTNEKKDSLKQLACRKNYAIVMTDGLPSVDNDKNRIKGVVFADWDTDEWTGDPSQEGFPNYYDDVAEWLYKHSWVDKSEVADPATSYVNLTTHHVAFGAQHPLLEDAASQSGGKYIAVYNKAQLAAAFRSLAMQMDEATSFSSPVVSLDAANKIQSGEDLYMGLFLPMDNTYWVGNVKKFKMGDGSTARPKVSMIYDAANHPALDSGGQFLDNVVPFWGKNINSKTKIKNGGAGERMLADVHEYFVGHAYWNRPIYTWKDNRMVKFDRTRISAADLAVADDATRDKLINFIHGYTYAAGPEGSPVAVREWILGAILHSKPILLDYLDTADAKLPLAKRLVAVGSNDGMLHVFDDTDGRELFAFIPPDLLPSLKNVQAANLCETVDGPLIVHHRDNNPKYLLFGERRGGGSYWNLDVSSMDPLQWTVAWEFTHPEIKQSWSEMVPAHLPWAINANGEKSYKEVVVFTGGYDPLEDNFPEPFDDQNSDGTPFLADGAIDPKEWSKNNPKQDPNNDGRYNTNNPGKDTAGRGIFVVDIDNPAAITTVTLGNGTTQQILPFSVTYGKDAVVTGAAQQRPDMAYAFPADPSVVTGADTYIYAGEGRPAKTAQDDVLAMVYAVDIYANVFKTMFSFRAENISANPDAPDWRVGKAGWLVNKVFGANPGSSGASGRMGGEDNPEDAGRKAFYSPTVSWGGTAGYFEAKKYFYPDVRFDNTRLMASLFFGTGDREHPNSTMIRNRFYAVYDDSAVTAQPAQSNQTVPVSSAPYREKNLLNLSCDELGPKTIIANCYLGSWDVACKTESASHDMKLYLRSLLKDDAVYGSPPALENGASHENDAKGWYIVLEDQGKDSACGHVTYPVPIKDASVTAHDNHAGEQVLSQPLLFHGNLYFTTYQASTCDPCHPMGNGFSYALDYRDGAAVMGAEHLIVNRYNKFLDVTGIPSSYTLLVYKGYNAWASMGAAIITPTSPGNDPTGLIPPFDESIPGPSFMEIEYWRDSLSK